MVRPEEIETRMLERPFRPLRILAAEGVRYDITHPDLVLVGGRDVMIGLPSGKKAGSYGRVVRVPISQIIGMEDLPALL
jgi:hypothetical protein